MVEPSAGVVVHDPALELLPVCFSCREGRAVGAGGGSVLAGQSQFTCLVSSAAGLVASARAVRLGVCRLPGVHSNCGEISTVNSQFSAGFF